MGQKGQEPQMCQMSMGSGSHLGTVKKMADIISGDKVSLFMDAFNSIADCTTGVLTTKNLGSVLKNLGENPTSEEIQDMINEVDKDGTGGVKFPAFLDMMAGKVDSLVAEDEIREAFRVFDMDGNGFVSRDELRYAIMNLGEKLSDDECAYLVDEADIDGDGQINYEEFCQMMNSAGSYNKADDAWSA